MPNGLYATWAFPAICYISFHYRVSRQLRDLSPVHLLQRYCTACPILLGMAVMVEQRSQQKIVSEVMTDTVGVAES